MLRLLFKTISLLALFLSLAAFCLADGVTEKAKPAKSLPDKIGTFRASDAKVTVNSAPARALPPTAQTEERNYIAPNGNSFAVLLARMQNDSTAYAFLTAAKDPREGVKIGDVGTASVTTGGAIDFVKGNAWVHIVNLSKNPPADELLQLANGIAQQLDKGEDDIPVLVKHLPNWESVQPGVSYVVSLQALKDLLPQQRILDAVSFEGSPEAVLAKYDAGKLLIIEFNTAKIAADNDWNIKTKISELRGGGANSALPSAYRRVGNYSVFVFDAPSEEVANELIDQVKYQQIVQWLGNDPYVYERATREFTETTLGVFVSVVKASGLALVTCLAVGGLFGAILFSRRRARTRNVDAYSDAGGMLRLNLDEMTPETDPSRLLGPGAH